LLFNSSIGIEINDRQVNIVYLKGSFKGVKLAAESICRLDPAKSGQDRQSDIVSFINGFIREEKITAADIFIGISGDHLMMREVVLPLAVKENLRTTLTYEIEKFLPVSADDVYFDYHVISESKEDEKIKLLLVAVKKNVFEYYLEIAAHIDKGVSGIGIVAAALANYFLYHQEPLQEPVILLYSRGSVCDSVILKQRSMVYAKSIEGTEKSDGKPALIGDSLIRLRDIFCPDEENTQVILYGISPSDDRFRGLADEFQNIATGAANASALGDQFIPAFGQALNGICTVSVDINLMPARLRKKPDKTAIYIMFGLAGLLVMAGVLWAGSHFMKQRQTMEFLDSEMTRLRAEASAVEKIQSETQQIMKNMAYIRSLRPGNAFVVEIAEELSNIIPADAWLTELKIVGNELTLYGAAESASGLISLLEDSQLFEKVGFISAIRKNREGKEAFRIGCKINAGK
jgi:Tfp pilus assembly protein PilN